MRRLQRRDLQLPRAAPGARGARASVRDPVGHRSHRPRLRGVRRRVRRATVGHVRPGAVGSAASTCCCWRAIGWARSRWCTTPTRTAGLAFASELQALLAHPDVPREVDPRAIDDYLTYLYVPAPTTAYRDVRKLPPGPSPGVADGPDDRRAATGSVRFGRKAAHLRRRGRRAVRRAVSRCRAATADGRRAAGRVPERRHGLELGRRRDGRAAAARPVKTFSIGFGERDFDELAYARQVAQRFGTEHHELVVEPRALDMLPTLVRHYGEPYGDSSAIPTYYVAQLTRQHVTVALNGDGGDELLAGYERHWAARVAARYDTIPRFVRHGLIRPLIPLVPEPRQRRAFLRRAKRFMTAAHLPVLDRYLHWVGAYSPAQKLSLYTDDFVDQLHGNDSGHWLREALAPEPYPRPGRRRAARRHAAVPARGFAGQSRHRQHGQLARSALAAARPSPGRVLRRAAVELQAARPNVEVAAASGRCATVCRPRF